MAIGIPSFGALHTCHSHTPLTPLANLQGPFCSGPGAWEALASISSSERSPYCTQRTSSLMVSYLLPCHPQISTMLSPHL